MIKKSMKSSELVIAGDGTLYHINLKASDSLPRNIFLVGDPQRAYRVAEYFDKGVVFERKNREFITLAGVYKGLPVAVMGIGIGPDNMEITAVELHALNEYDCENGGWKKDYKPLNIIRLGTSGSSQKDIPVGSLAVSKYAIGLDNIGLYYPYSSPDKTVRAIKEKINKTAIKKVRPYVSAATPEVAEALIQGCKKIGLKQGEGKGFYCGITTTAPGFFAPQGRKIGRLAKILIPDLQEILAEIKVDGLRPVNNEMETSAMFRIFGEILNYRVGSICAVLANRNLGEFVSPDEYEKSVDRCIRAGLEAMEILNC